jgi:hypothetical protein
MGDEQRAAAARRSAYAVMIVATAAAITGRILSAERVFEPSLHRPEPAMLASPVVAPLAAGGPLAALTQLAAADAAWQAFDPDLPPRTWPRSRPQPMPTFSSNDRSRWATVRALVDEGTFVIGRRVYDGAGRYRDTGIIFEDGWGSVDKVLHPRTKEFYSSKPPLLPVALAGEYWLLQRLFGWTIADEPWRVIPTILITVNVLPFVVYLVLLFRLLEQYGSTDWGRLFTFAAACFGTYINTFSISLNNHTLAAYTTLFAVYPLLRRAPAAPSDRDFVVVGFFAGLTFCLELPAAALLAALAVGCFWLAPRRAVLAFVPAALLPVGAQVATNYAALGDPWPAYAKVETEWYQYEGSHWAKEGDARKGIDFAGDVEPRHVYAFHLLLGHHGLFSLTPLWLLTVAGLATSLSPRSGMGTRWRQVMWLTAGVSVVVIVFFAAVVSTVNYGGWTSGPRWFFWLTPLWLLGLLPAADRLAASPIGRIVGYVCLALSTLAVSYPAWNPWRHPWIYQAMEGWGWPGYE